MRRFFRSARFSSLLLGGVLASLLASLLAALSPAPEAAARDESSSENASSAEVSLEISAAPRTVYRGVEVELEARTRPLRRATYRWRVSDGTLFSDDRRRVTWKTPDRAGNVEVDLEARIVGSPPDAPPLHRRVKITLHAPSREGMARIAGGVSTIGDTWTDVDHPEFILTNQNQADKPPHRVELRPFHIDRDRVTNLQFARFLEAAVRDALVEVTPVAVMGRHGRALVPYYWFSYDDMKDLYDVPGLRGIIRREGARFVIKKGHERHPVVDVTWPGAAAYARYHGKRLPTNAEWELAGRGVDGRRYPWGNVLPTPLHANVNNFYEGRLFPVGSFSPLGDSPYGVRDMVGGIFEWVHDWYNETYYADVASPEPVRNPQGPHWGRDHVIRGVSATQGIVGELSEQPPLSFRYTWIFEVRIGDGVATSVTGFRTALDDHAWRDARRHRSRGDRSPTAGTASGTGTAPDKDTGTAEGLSAPRKEGSPFSARKAAVSSER